MQDQAGTHTVAIVGGGFSGAALAYHLARDPAAAALRILIIEPREKPGKGLAYSTPDPDHRLNVPNGRMTIRTDDMGHFTRWLAGPSCPDLPADSTLPTGQIFAPRAVFGAYVADTLAPFLAEGSVRHLRTMAEDVTRHDDRFRVTLADGSTLVADSVFLALSHPAPAIPRQLLPLKDSAALIPDAFAPHALDAIATGDRVLVVGSGLTSGDILATLDRRGHTGPIDVISRHGWRSMPHGPAQAETLADFTTDPETTALGLLRRVRRALAMDEAAGLTWHAVFDCLRNTGPTIWAALPQPERARFLRHLRGLWDVHRFRIAPQTYATQGRLEQSGRARFLRGKLQAVAVTGLGIRVTWRPRGSHETADLTVDRVVLATGPDHAGITRTNPLLRKLAAAGLIAPDPLHLGLHTAPGGEAIGPEGQPTPGLYVAGPLARGTVGELMGLPEVTAWSEFLARRAFARIAASTHRASDPAPVA